MRIEKLESSQRKAGRWLVWLEDGSLLRIGESQVVALALYQGKELSPEEAAALTQAAQQSKLDERAVELLSARAMSEKELVDKLSARPHRKKGEEELSPEQAALRREELDRAARDTARRMAQLGLLNDREYAGQVVRHYAAKGYGARKLKEELYRRGVPREYWEEALAQPEEGSEAALDRLVERKLRGAQLTRETLKKTSDYLARRGFGWEEISAALRRYGADCEE